MKVGDLVKCGDETALILDVWWSTDSPQSQWVKTLWDDGSIEEFEPRFYELEVIGESR